MEKYIEIIQTETKKVVKRMRVTDMSERTIDKTESGMNINLNHSAYHTNFIESETELPIGDFQ